jgi:DNA replication and repair protein RecF
MRTALSREGERAYDAAIAPGPQISIAQLKLTNFRNYISAQLTLDQRPVVLVGDNGAGKTNLLEAVSLLGAGQGLRGRPLAELGRKDGPGGFAISARIVSREGEVEIGTGFGLDAVTGTEGRVVRIAGKERSPGALAEHVTLVWLIPAMDGLFTGPASERRRFLDRLVLAIDPKMRTPLARFDRAMRQRNRLFLMREGSPSLFEGLEAQMAEAAIAIAAARLNAVSRLAGLIEGSRSLRGDGPFPWAALATLGTLEADLAERPATEVEDDYFRGLVENRDRDRAAGRALEGPHLSDLLVRHGPSDAPAHSCSSGEQKALLIGLVLAHAELIKVLQGAVPLVLLDEVAAHLDHARREGLFAEILRLNAQAWMTGTDAQLFDSLGAQAQHVAVANGTAVPHK